MFGRIFDIQLGNPGETGFYLIRPELGINNLIFEAEIEKFPGVDINKMTLTVYNASKEIDRTIKSEKLNNIVVKFGYEDEGGILSTIFSGNIVRSVYQRENPETTKTIIYSYQNGNFIQYGFYSGTLIQGCRLEDAVSSICNYVDTEDTSGGQVISYTVDTSLSDVVLPETISLFCDKDSALKKVANLCNVEYQMLDNLVVFKPISSVEGQISATVFTRQLKDGRIESTNGLIGIPSLTTEGLQFSCLVNPNIDIYSYVKFDNSVISDDRLGFVPETQFGAQLDANGIYKVTGINIHLANDGEDNYMEVTALAKDVYEGDYDT